MISFPNCKINIGLNIVGKRTDGFHNIETIFFPLALCDALEVLLLPDNMSDEFSIEGVTIDGDPDQNLCMKALRLMQNKITLPKLKIILQKNIPIGAGLGGGSADAAFTLKLINEFGRCGFSDEKLIEMASQLGSDCAFFVINKPVFAEGKGDVMTPVFVNLEGYSIVIVKPPVFVSTAEAYSGVCPKVPEYSLKELVLLPVSEWPGLIRNDFEETIFPKYPEIAAIKQSLYEMGAVYASMSGSGSSVFGIFNEPLNADYRFPGCFYHEEII